jgi:integrase
VPRVVSADIEESHLQFHAFPQLGGVPLRDLTRSQLTAWVQALGARISDRTGEPLAPRTIHHIAGTVKRCLEEAVDAEELGENPCHWRRIHLPKKLDRQEGKRTSGGLDGWEVHALLTDERIPEDRRVMYGFDFCTGMRPGEVSARRWRDVDTTTTPLWRLDVATAHNSRHKLEKSTKTNVEKIIPIHPRLAELLRHWYTAGWAAFMGRDPTGDDLIVPRAEGGNRTDSHSNKRFKADLERLGLRGGRSHYESRATFRSLAIAGGAPDRALDLITHPSPKEAKDAYTRTDQVWPALCAAVLAVKIEPCDPEKRPARGDHKEDHTLQAEKEKARRLAGFGPLPTVGAVGLEGAAESARTPQNAPAIPPVRTSPGPRPRASGASRAQFVAPGALPDAGPAYAEAAARAAAEAFAAGDLARGRELCRTAELAGEERPPACVVRLAR